MLKIQFYAFILSLIATCYTLETRTRQHNTHQILFDDSWQGSRCNDACQARGGTVCGHFQMQCCNRCTGFPRYTCDGDKLRQLDCSYKKPENQGIIAKMSSNSTWLGSDCNDACELATGAVCGNVFKECCKIRCETTAFIYESCFQKDTYKQLDCSYKKPETAGSNILGGFKKMLCIWC